MRFTHQKPSIHLILGINSTIINFKQNSHNFQESNCKIFIAELLKNYEKFLVVKMFGIEKLEYKEKDV